MHTTKSFRINQPARSMLNALAHTSAQGETQDIFSKLCNYPRMYLEKVKCISYC